MPTTELWMASFKLKSRIGWLASQFPEVGQPEYVSIHLQSSTIKRPESFPEKILREEFCELLEGYLSQSLWLYLYLFGNFSGYSR